MPSLHQRPMYMELKRLGVDLQVRYFEKILPSRLEQGWPNIELDPSWEGYVNCVESPFETVPDWKNRVHIITGYRHAYLRNIIREFCKYNIEWIHWSESVVPRFSIKGLMRLFLLKWYGRLVRKYALGSFAMDSVGKRQFISWGIDASTVLHLPYSVKLVLDSKSRHVEQIAKFSKGRVIFCYIGSMIKPKGIDTLLLACILLKKWGLENKFCVLLVGVEDENRLVSNYLSTYSLSNCVFYFGKAPMNEVQSITTSIDVLVHPSRYDGWGATLSEAALNGKPVISTEAVGSARVLIKHGETGIFIPSGDAVKLAKAMMFYTLNPNIIDLHGKSIMSLALEYTAERNAKRLIDGIVFLRFQKNINDAIPNGNLL